MDHALGTRSLWLRFAVFCLLALFIVTAWPGLTPTAVAQEGQPPAGENPPPAPPPGAPPAQQSTGLVWHILVSVGWFFGIVMFVTSVAMLALVVLLILDLRMGGAVPPAFVEDFTDTVNKRQFKAAYEMAKDDGSYLGRVMTAGMARLQYGIEDAREAAFNMVNSIRAGKDQPITFLAAIATLGPLLGLVGTVWGMIRAFKRMHDTGMNDVNSLSGDISHALVVTLIGVAIAVPAVFFHAFFKNRLTRIAMEVANVPDDLLTQMYHNSKKPAPAAAAPATATAVPATAAPTNPAIRQ